MPKVVKFFIWKKKPKILTWFKLNEQLPHLLMKIVVKTAFKNSKSIT